MALLMSEPHENCGKIYPRKGKEVTLLLLLTLMDAYVISVSVHMNEGVCFSFDLVFLLLI